MDESSFLSNFNDLTIGTELYGALRLSSAELVNPNLFSQVKEIADFLQQSPDPSFIISRTKNNKGSMSNLEFLTGYVRLQKDRISVKDKLTHLDKEISWYE